MIHVVRSTGWASLLAIAGLSFGLVPKVDAQPSTVGTVGTQPSISGPVVTANHTEVAPGDSLVLTIDGFKAKTVTISVCGNNARRGSADCNMTASKGRRLNDDATATLVQIGAASPPVGCPCVIRVSSMNNDEVAVAPITLIGHPTEPVVGGPSLDDPLVALSISVRAAPRGLLGWIRSGLAGPSTYEVTVIVRNLTTEPLRHVAMSGSVGRSARNTLVTLALDDPGEIGPGQIRQQVIYAEVPAPTFGSVEWRVAASGAGPTVTAIDTTHHRPVLLLLFLIVLVVDLAVLGIRRLILRHAAGDVGRGDDAPGDGAPSEDRHLAPLA